MFKQKLIGFALILTVTQFVGCAASPKRVIFNEDNPTMESILHGNVTRENTFPTSQTDTSKFDQQTESSAVASTGFRELTNPTLILHIEPHITKGGTYLPGMKVPYKQYNNVEFALPGER